MDHHQDLNVKVYVPHHRENGHNQVVSAMTGEDITPYDETCPRCRMLAKK
jgi:hypothetical protein